MGVQGRDLSMPYAVSTAQLLFNILVLCRENTSTADTA